MKLTDHPDNHKNDRGHALKEQGMKVEGMKLIREAAENGQPNSLATLLWVEVIDDEIQKAISDFEKCLPKTYPWIASEKSRVSKLWLVSQADKDMIIDFYNYQVSNSKSNAALAYLASGNEPRAMELWNEAAMNHGHIEARFYPIFHLCKSNPGASLGVLTNSFTKQELQSLISDLVDVSSRGSGWFAKWADEGLKVLQKAVHSKGNFKGAATATAAGGAAFMASKQFNNFMKDQIEENFGDGEGVADWLGDLF
jgi:hypothetical protein